MKHGVVLPRASSVTRRGGQRVPFGSSVPLEAYDGLLAFFEPPPPPPPPPAPYRRPKWARPQNVLGEPVPITFLLARSTNAAVQIQHLTAFPEGFEFRVVARCRLVGDVWDPMHGLAGYRGRPGARGLEMSDEILRFGIQFADGSKATNLGPPMLGPPDQAQRGPMLQHAGGSSGGSVAETTFWVWPLPPPGPLAFVCEWPKFGIPLTRQEVDANLIREAAKRVIELWPEEEEPTYGGGTRWTYSGLQQTPQRRPDRRPEGGKGKSPARSS